MSEKDVENSILTWLNMQQGVFAFKIETQGQYDPKKNIFRRPGKFVIKGTSDIVGLCDGKFFCIEVKSGPDKKASPEQKTFISKVQRCGGYGRVAWNIDQARELIDGIRLGITGKEDDRTGPTLC